MKDEIKEKIKAGKKLTLQETKELIMLGNVTLFKRYISRIPLPEEVEVELVKSNNRDAIKVYVNVFPLCQDAEVELVKLGNEKLIKFYADRRGFRERAQEELAKSQSMFSEEIYRRYSFV